MPDVENTSAAELAAQINGAQNAEAAPAESGAITPSPAEEIREEKLYAGKYKTVEALEAAHQELQRNFTVSRQTAATPPVPTPQVPPTTATFDQETEVGIKSIVEQKLAEEKSRDEATKAMAWAQQHEEELKDPLLRAAVAQEIREANGRNEYMDRDVALANAKEALEARLSTRIDDAKKEVTEENKQLSRQKQLAGAVGGTSKANPDVNPDDLSAEEYAEFYNIPRV